MNIKEKIEYISKGTVDLITKEDLKKKLQKDNLVIKYGVDPTSPDMHLGHLVPIKKLRDFQNIGYKINFLIGDFTAMIGDPSERATGRKAMSRDEVLANAETYKNQIFKILNPEKTIITYNSDWLDNINLGQFINILGKNTINNLIKRKSTVKRMKNGEGISGHELIYPFLQAYDSVAMEADIEVGGTDQYFNLLFGRDMQPKYGQEPQVIITTPLLEGFDGKKMSKSAGNTVDITDNPVLMYAKIMKIKDDLIGKYFSVLTEKTVEDIEKINQELSNGINPRDIKMDLAREITGYLHSARQAKTAEEEFIKVYTLKEQPENMKEINLAYTTANKGIMTPVQLLRHSSFAESNTQARNLIKQRGFSIDGLLVENPVEEIELRDNMILKVGKDKFAKINYFANNEDYA